MKRLVMLAVLAGALCTASSASAQSAPVAFTDTYPGFNSWNACGTSQKILGYEPAGGGGYPVFIYLHGYSGEGAAVDWKVMTSEAAKFGFVAAAPRYASLLTFSLSSMDQQAKCIFSDGASTALSKVCARPEADCSKGVVVSGLSLGSTIAARSGNYSNLVRAAYLLGMSGPRNTQLLSPADGGTRAIPDSRMRLTIGRRDVTNYDTLNLLTGKSCTTYDCLGSDGSGWYAVQDSQVWDKVADHCFHFFYGCLGFEDPYDPGWRPGSTQPWALDPGLQWEKGFTG